MAGGISGALPGGLGGLGSLPGTGTGGSGAPTPNNTATGEQSKSFGDALGDMVLRKPSEDHAVADSMAADFAAGGNVDPHQLAIATAKAGVEIQMATRTISQAVSAVRTLFQMQI